MSYRSLDGPIPAAVVRFLNAHIGSVSELEVMLLLAQDRREWTTREIATEMSLTEEFAELILSRLERARLVNTTERGVLLAVSEAHASHVDALSALYARYRVRLTSIILAQR